MDIKIKSMEKIREEEFVSELPLTFRLKEIGDYIENIEEYLNKLDELAKEDKKYHDVCTSEKLKILSSIYDSFFKILFCEIDWAFYRKDFDTAYRFSSELIKLNKQLSNIEVLKQSIDNPVLKLENKEED